MITQEENAFLEKARQKLLDNYRGTIKGLQPILQGTAQVAYAKGFSDCVKMIGEQGFDLIRAPKQEPAAPPPGIFTEGEICGT